MGDVDIDTNSSFETIDNITPEKSDDFISLVISFFSSKVFDNFEYSVSQLWIYIIQKIHFGKDIFLTALDNINFVSLCGNHQQF